MTAKHSASKIGGIDGAASVDLVTKSQLDLKAPIASPTFTGTVGGVTAAMVGLGNVDNTSNVTERAASATLTNKTLTSPVITTPVLNGIPTGTGVAVGATASTLALRDSNANLAVAGVLDGYTTTATAAGTTTLTVSSNYGQYFTGTTTQTAVLPVASTLTLGQQWLIVNSSTGAVTVQSSGANNIVVLAGGTAALLTCILTSGTTAASWQSRYFGAIITSGKSLSVSNSLTLAGTDGTTLTFQGTDTYVGRTTTDTLTNKTLTSPVINTPTGIVKADVGLGNVDNTSDATKNSASVTLTNKTITTPVINGIPTGTGVAAAATASTLALRDANGNLTAAAFLEGYATSVTAAGTTTLTVSSSYNQYFTGTSTQTVALPVASTLVLGQQWLITNSSTGAVTVQSSGANTVIVLAGATSALLTCILTSGTTAASWQATYFGGIFTSGKSMSASNTLTLAGTDGTTLTFQATDTYVGRATTDTLTNKRVTKRTGTTTSSATPTINTDNVDFYSLTAQTADITSFSTNLSGTPTVAQTLWIAVTGTAARAITWGASFEASTVALPTTTVTTARLDVGFVWNDATSKWRVVAVS